MERFLRRIVGNPVKVISLMLLITIAMGWRLPQLRFQNSMYDLTIEDLPERVRYEAFKSEFGSEEIILVVARSENAFDPSTFERIDRLAQELSGIEGVNRVISLPGIKKDIDLTDRLSLAEFQEVLAPVNLLSRTLLSTDKKTTATTLILDDQKDRAQVIESVQAIIDEEKENLAPYQIGLPLISQALEDFTEADFLTLPPITFLVISLVLVLIFRSFWGVLAPAGMVLTGLIWTFGAMAWSDTPLSLMTMIVPVFLIAVGMAYCMHVFAEYRHALLETPSSAEAAFLGIRRILLPTTLAVATTIVSVFSLLICKINAIREFAIFSVAGMLFMLVIIYTLMPALLALLPHDRTDEDKVPHEQDIFDRVLEKIITINVRYRRVSLPIIAVVVIWAISGIFLIKVENNPIEYFKENAPISRHFHDVYRDMSGSIPINVTVTSQTGSYFEEPSSLQQLEQFQRFLDTLDGVDKTESFADYLKLVNYATNQYDKEYYKLPEQSFEVRMLTNSFMSILGSDLYSRFMNADSTKANILLRTHITGCRNCLQTQRKISDYVSANLPGDLAVEVTGFGIVMAQSTEFLTMDQLQSLSLDLFLIFCIMFFLFLSLKVGLIAMVPNLFLITMNFGLMGWLGIELSFATSLIASIAIGLAIDDTIHYMFVSNIELRKGLDRESALRVAVRHIGRPKIYTTLTISLGFTVLLFSNFQPTSAFGLLMVATMLMGLVGDLFVLPALMVHAKLVTVWDILRIEPDELFTP